MTNKNYFISQSGLARLKEELHHLKTVKRPQVIERIQSARMLGDLSENSEYDDARNEQSFVEGRIEQLEELVKNAKVVTNGGHESVIVGSAVDLDINGQTKTYQIVSINEVNPSQGKISIDSPIGRALAGKKAGEEAMIKVPAGELKARILKVN